MGYRAGLGSYTIPAAAIGAATLSSFTPHIQGDTMTQNTESVRNMGSTPAVSMVDERLLTAKLEAVDARTETKFVQLMGKVELIVGSISALEGKVDGLKADVSGVKEATASVKWNILAAGLAVGALILGLFAFGTQMFELAAGLVAK